MHRVLCLYPIPYSSWSQLLTQLHTRSHTRSQGSFWSFPFLPNLYLISCHGCLRAKPHYLPSGSVHRADLSSLWHVDARVTRLVLPPWPSTEMYPSDTWTMDQNLWTIPSGMP